MVMGLRSNIVLHDSTLKTSSFAINMPGHEKGQS